MWSFIGKASVFCAVNLVSFLGGVIVQRKMDKDTSDAEEKKSPYPPAEEASDPTEKETPESDEEKLDISE